MKNPLTHEPVAVGAAVNALVALVATLGFHVDTAAVGPLVAIVTALVAVITRARVTPVAAQSPAAAPQAPAAG